MPLDEFMIDKRVIQRNIESGKVDATQYAELLRSLPDLSGHLWRRPEPSPTPSASASANESAHAAAPAAASTPVDLDSEDDDDDDDDDPDESEPLDATTSPS